MIFGLIFSFVEIIWYCIFETPYAVYAQEKIDGVFP